MLADARQAWTVGDQGVRPPSHISRSCAKSSYSYITMRTVAKKRGNKDDIENKQAWGEQEFKKIKINVDKDRGGGCKTPPTQNSSKLTPDTTTSWIWAKTN